MDELNAQIEDLEEQAQILRNEKVKRKLFNHFDIEEEDLGSEFDQTGSVSQSSGII